MSEQEQGENVGRMKVLRLELKKSEDKRMDVNISLETVRCCTDAITITKRMVAELIQSTLRFILQSRRTVLPVIG